MILSKRVGLFSVDCNAFQSSCLPYPEKILNAIATHLPVFAVKRNDALLNVVKVHQRLIMLMFIGCCIYFKTCSFASQQVCLHYIFTLVSNQVRKNLVWCLFMPYLVCLQQILFAFVSQFQLHLACQYFFFVYVASYLSTSLFTSCFLHHILLVTITSCLFTAYLVC